MSALVGPPRETTPGYRSVAIHGASGKMGQAIVQPRGERRAKVVGADRVARLLPHRP